MTVRSAQRGGVGARDIVRFNWPPYLAATTAAFAGCVVSIAVPSPILGAAARLGIGALAVLAALWVAGSISVAWWVFDHSGVTRWRWLDTSLGGAPRRWVNVTTGFDDTTSALRTLFPKSDGATIDLFDPLVAHERSILRARAACPPMADSLAVGSGSLPFPEHSVDAVLYLMAAHELRAEGGHAGAFAEARRILAPGGRVVIVEHLRDFPNAVAFGPGVLHFYSRRHWVEAADAAGLSMVDEVRLTPFVRGFVFEQVEITAEGVVDPSWTA